MSFNPPFLLVSADSHAHTAVGHNYRAHDEARAIRCEDVTSSAISSGFAARPIGAFLPWSKEGLSIIHLTPPNIRYHVANADSVNPNTVLNRLKRKRSR